MTIRISDFTAEATHIEQQIIDVRAYAAETAPRYGWDLVAEMDDTALGEAIGARKNSRGAINAVYAVVKPQDDARRAAQGDNVGAKAEAAALVDDKAAIDEAAAAKRATKAEQARARRAAKKAAAAA